MASLSARRQFPDVFKNVLTYTGTLDLGSAGDNDGTGAAFASANVTVPGAALGDFVLVSLGVDTVDLTLTAAVTAANVVTVTVNNPTINAVNLASTTVRICVLQPNEQVFYA